MENPITTEEKIDYIYTTLKKNEKKVLMSGYLKWGFRLFLVWYMFYFIKVGLPLLIDSFVPSLPSIWSQGSTDQIQNILSDYLSK